MQVYLMFPKKNSSNCVVMRKQTRSKHKKTKQKRDQTTRSDTERSTHQDTIDLESGEQERKQRDDEAYQIRGKQ